MDEIILFTSRAVDPLSRILNNVWLLVYNIFVNNTNGYMRQLVTTIMNNEYLLIGVSLLFCGFVIGLLSRLVRV